MIIISKYKRCLLAVSAVIIWTVCSSLAWGAITAQERSALIAFYNATGGDNWGDNWKTPPLDLDGFSTSGTEVSWYGIIPGLFLIRSLPNARLKLAGPPPVFHGIFQIVHFLLSRVRWLL